MKKGAVFLYFCMFQPLLMRKLRISNEKVLGIVLCGVVALMAAKPTGQEVSKVMDYYYTGNEAVIVEYKFCKEVVKEGDHKNDCAVEVDSKSVKKGEKVYLWLNAMVPKDAKVILSTQFIRKGRALKNRESKMNGSLRYRTWFAVPTAKTGAIEVSIDQEKGDDYVSIEKLGYTVVE